MPRTLRWTAAAMFLLAALVWSRALQNGFVHVDDPYYLTQNALVQRGLTWDGVVAAFTSAQVWNWHPLTMLSHMIDVELFGLNPTGHHLVSVVLHIAAGALLFGLLREATRDPWLALFVAAVFVLHPLRVQSVAWASERKDVLSGAFWMAALWSHVRWTRAGAAAAETESVTAAETAEPWKYRVATVTFGLAAMLSKPMAVTLPITLILFDVWPLARVASWRDLRSRIVAQWPLFAGAVVVAAMTIAAQEDAIDHAAARAPELRLAAGVVALPRYLAMIAWPWPLSVSHSLYQEQPPPALAFAAALAIAALTTLLVTAVWRARSSSATRASGVARAALVGWFWFVATLLPVLGIVQVGSQAVADRYTYLPTIGVLLAVAFAVRTATMSGQAGVATTASTATTGAATTTATTATASASATVAVVAVVALVVVVACAWRTWVEIGAWHDPVALASRAVEADPDDHDARVDLALRLGEIGDFPAAIHALEQAVRIKANAHTWDLLGQAYARAGRTADAVAALETATTVDASLAKVHVHLAEAYVALASRDEALRAIEAALAIEPAWPRALEVRSRLLAPPIATP